MNRKFTFLIFLFFLVSGIFTNVKADHMVGSDIYWKCDGGDTFTITIVDYRDCNGIAFVNSPFILTPVGGCSISASTTVNGASSGGTDITPVCNRSCDRCPSNASCAFPYGIQQYFITATVVLPDSCCDYQISWTQCCRSAGITTGATWANYYITSKMSRCTFGYCDNSPYFTDPPVAIYCTNQCITYNPGASDIDRGPGGNPDSLSYAFTPPLTAAGSNTPWSGSYSYTKPLDYDGFPSSGGTWNPPQVCKGFHLDSTTGDIEFKAVKADVTVISLDVSEWRKDSLGVYHKIGEIRRDMQIIIVDCPTNNPPIIPGINGGNTYSEKICADKQTCFNVKAFDLDQSDTDKLTWNNPGTMDGATFTVVPDGKKWPTAVFCWYPTDKDVRSYPYTFVATAKDNACPIPGFNSRAFSVYVIAAPSAVYNANVGKCGVVTFQASPSATSSTSISKYLWVGEGSPGYGPLYIIGRTGTYKYTRGGTYHYSLIITGPNGCTRNYTDSVVIPKFPGVSLPKDTLVCNNSPTITLTAKLVNAFLPYNIWWNLTDSKGDSLTTGTITVIITHDTAIRVNILDQGCSNYDSMIVKVKPLPKPNLGPDQRGCWGHPVILSTGLKHEPFVKWTWILGKDTVRNQYHGDTIMAVDSGIFAVSVQDSIGCPGTDTANVFFNPPVVAKKVPDSTVCLNAHVTVRAGLGGPGASYQWIDRIHNKIIGTGTTYSFIANSAGGYGKAADLEIIIKNTNHGLTCVDTGYYNITVNTPTPPNVSPLPPKCISDPAYQLPIGPPLVDPTHQGGTWVYPKKPSAIINNFLYPSVMGRTDNDPSLGLIRYVYRNQFGCDTYVTVKFTVSLLPQVSAGPDTEICTAKGPYLLSNVYVTPTGGSWLALKSTNTPPGAIKYSKNRDSVFFDPNYAGVNDKGVYGIIYNYKDPAQNGKSSCSNADTVFITVSANPNVTVTQVDSLCLNAGERDLTSFANPQNGTWTFTDGTNPAALIKHTLGYGFLPSAAGSGWHRLLYTLYGDRVNNLCPTFAADSVYVVPAPVNPDFTTSDKQWEYCVNHGNVLLVPTINGSSTKLGIFSSSPNQGEVINNSSGYYFVPRVADTVYSSNNIVKYTIYYNKGQCSVAVDHKIVVDGRPFVRITSPPSVCAGQNSFDIKAVKSKNTTTLVWSSAGGLFKPLNSDSTDVMFFPSPAQLKSGDFQVRVTASNSGLCTSNIATANFNINAVPVIDFSSKQTGCEPFATHFTSIVTVKGINNSSLIKSYEWDFGDGSAHSNNPNPYHVYNVTNGKDTQQFNVKLTVVSDSGCVKDTIKNGWITVYATPKPIVSANPQYTTIALPQVQFSFDPRSSGIDFNDPNTTYAWTFGDSTHTISTLRNPQYTYGDTGKFIVRLQVSSKGCVGDTSIVIYVQPELIIYIPNVFKPDGKHGDGKTPIHEPNYFSANVNNTFQPVISAYATFSMNVYNRWGQEVYTTTNPNKGWDGRYQGADAQEGVYVYVIKATGYLGKPYTFTGSITMVR